MQQVTPTTTELTIFAMKKVLAAIGIAVSVMSLSAQEKGYLTGSFETNDHIYVKDEANRFTPDDDNFGTRHTESVLP